jgi:hypothetical protein
MFFAGIKLTKKQTFMSRKEIAKTSLDPELDSLSPKPSF